MQIERSMANYWRLKGRVICSACLDLQDAHQKNSGPDDQDRATDAEGR